MCAEGRGSCAWVDSSAGRVATTSGCEVTDGISGRKMHTSFMGGAFDMKFRNARLAPPRRATSTAVPAELTSPHPQV